MARKLNKNLVALGSAAIVTVYAVGFARTETPAAGTTGGASVALTDIAAPRAPTTDAATAIARAIASVTPSPAAGGTPARSVASGYRDGVYSGSGTSRFGGFEVAVTIKGGSITGVELTRVTTKYPASRIARLPDQVVERQSANVDLVSGATASAQAFRSAVTQALAKASSGAAQS